MTRERGSGKTPERVVRLLREEVQRSSMLAVSRATGIGLAAIGRYLKGIGEPTTATLEKLAVYFKKSVAYLRGIENREYFSLPEDIDKWLWTLENLIEIYELLEKPELKETVRYLLECEFDAFYLYFSREANKIDRVNPASLGEIREEDAEKIDSASKRLDVIVIKMKGIGIIFPAGEDHKQTSD